MYTEAVAERKCINSVQTYCMLSCFQFWQTVILLAVGTCTPLAVHYIHVSHVSIRAGSQYFACVALWPEVNVNASLVQGVRGQKKECQVSAVCACAKLHWSIILHNDATILIVFNYVVARVLAESQYLIVYCLWISKPNPYPLNFSRLSIDFLPVH